MPLNDVIERKKNFEMKRRRKSIHRESQFFYIYNIIYCWNISLYARIELIIFSRITSNESNLGKDKGHS